MEDRPAPSTPEAAIAEEFLSDVKSYTPDAVAVARKHYVEKQKLLPKEQSLFDRARSAWWQEKYGFSWDQKHAREELLRKKYDFREETEEMIARRTLQNELFTAVTDNDQARLQEIKDIYIERYPDQLEGVMALLELPAHIDNDHYLSLHSFQDNDPEIRQEMLRRVEETTQYHFLLSHFILGNRNDKEFLGRFWETLEQLAKAKGDLKSAHKMRRGILSQVATHRIFEKLEMHPKLSHPAEDAFKAVDLWIEGTGAVQVKGTEKKYQELFVETDSVSFPGTAIEHKNGTTDHYSGYLAKEMQRFTMKLDKYGRERGEELKGYFVVVPYHEFDFVTGEPSDAIVGRCATSLGVIMPDSKQNEVYTS